MHEALSQLGADRHIYRAILSHAHADHIGGFIGLIEDFGYTIDAAVYAPHPHYGNTQTNRTLMNALADNDVPLIDGREGRSVLLGWCFVEDPEPACRCVPGHGRRGQCLDRVPSPDSR